MAFRTALRRAATPSRARFLSQAATATAAATSTSVGGGLTKPVAGLSHPDPDAASHQAALVNIHAPFMVATYSRPGPIFVHGEGSYLYDLEARKYLDFTAGIAVNSLGHCDPQVTELIAKQAGTLVHASNLYYNMWTGQLSMLLVEKTIASGGMHDAAAVFICNSGSEANEAGIKFARKVGKVLDPSGAKVEIVSFRNAFHGRTMGSLSATPNPKYQAPFAPMMPGFRVGEYNDIAGLEALITDKTCGVIVEPIQGEGGVQVASEAFLVALGKRCREVGAVLHYDEIQCGLSRTGSLWAHSHLPHEAHPDILTTAKALGNGFPIGATIVNAHVADKIKVGDHGTTFGGNPLACRVAHSIVTRLAEPALQEQVVAKGAVFARGFKQLMDKYPGLISEIRGKGLILGVQLTEDPAPIVQAARERGLLVITAGTNTLRFVPSLLVTEGEIQEGLKILDRAIEATRAKA
ncbi:putative acetylornithine aminotransferase precursor [Podospora appendiculata]|uniref:acetylornithine transaminase n=1 Tax=Podospora appendiculata TaxID=314037 RepID=A0AAE0X3T0_9PEZI|nr:putative acetylornithine aminotransferase precursor [Podospora appendiculata]